MTKRTRPWIQAAKMSFLRRVAGVPLRGQGKKLSHLCKAQSRATAPLCGGQPAVVV